MKKRSWRAVFAKSKPYTDDFDNYKVPESKGVLPNRAKFTGDKFPSAGDSAKKELKHWKDGNRQYEKDKKVEEKAKVPSPISFGENRREFVGKETAERTKQSKWGKFFRKFSDVNFQQSPDGSIEIKVENDEMNEGMEYIEKEMDTGDIKDEETVRESNWRNVLSGDADLDFKRSPDGTMTLKVKHLDEEGFDNSEPSQSPQTPGTVLPSPSQESFYPEQQQDIVASFTSCNDNKDIQEYILRKDKNIRLVARECEDKVGIFIEERPKGVLASRVKKNIKILASEVHERKGKQWRELINESVWIARYDEVLKKTG